MIPLRHHNPAALTVYFHDVYARCQTAESSLPGIASHTVGSVYRYCRVLTADDGYFTFRHADFHLFNIRHFIYSRVLRMTVDKVLADCQFVKLVSITDYTFIV